MNQDQFQSHYKQIVDEFNLFVSQTARGWLAEQPKEIVTLVEAMIYSLENGGKRFRPVLATMVGDLFHCERKKIFPYAMAVECIHTYSMIHDDLPCMDDDKERRGQPTNHVIYGEDTALIAGDALLTVAFEIISDFYQHNPAISVQLCKTLARAAGFNGMVGGQAIDLKAQKDGVLSEDLTRLHELKTGALIASAAKGAAIISECSDQQVEKINQFARLLGLAFQVADDLLDFQPENPELGNFATVNGAMQTQQLLNQITEQALSNLAPWQEKAEALRGIVQFNLLRQV